MMKRSVRVATVVMGFSGLVAEILLLRELLIVFSGNELAIGIILANWLLIEAGGSFFAGRAGRAGAMAKRGPDARVIFAGLASFFSLSVLGALFLTRILKNILGISIGESIALLPMFYTSFLILLPVSLSHGALFTFGCQIYATSLTSSARDEAAAGKVYIYETVGTMAGGIICTYLLIPHLNTFQAASWLAMGNFITGLILLAPYRKRGLGRSIMLAILSLLLVASGYLVLGGQADRLHHDAIQAQWKRHNIVHYQNSPYGNICVIENQGQYIYFQDGVPDIIIPAPDINAVEEFVHLPLLTHPDPTHILILSGGAGGVIAETLKHPSIAGIDYAELDPLLLALLRKFPTPLTESELNDARVQLHAIDGRLLLKTTPHRYDLIFVGMMAPSSLQANRFFTREFFALAKAKLDVGGILVLSAPGSFTLLNEELQNLNSIIFHTLDSVFTHVRVIPGDGRNLFLASDSGAIATVDKAQVVARLTERDITANVIVPWHIENKLHPGWQDWFAQFISGRSREINRDFRPVGLFYSLAHWNALYAPTFGAFFKQFERINLGMMVALFALFLLAYGGMRRAKRIDVSRIGIPFSIVTTGFAGMIFDLVVIFTFQSIYGYVFAWIGLLVAFFMAGAAGGALLGAALMHRIPDDAKLFHSIEAIIACFAIGLPAIFMAGQRWLSHPSVFPLFRLLFLIISSLCGLLIGSQFPLANKLYLRDDASVSQTAGLLYAADLLGGWVGGIVGAVVLLPVLGLIGACVTVGLLKLASLIVIATSMETENGKAQGYKGWFTIK